MTAPLTPPDCDLQDFPFMPLHVARLRDSDLAAEAKPEACWYAVLLWAASWHQIPAGSLPDNDAVLAKLIGLGRDVRTFRRHKAEALRGFILCDDGRLYHPVVAEQALVAWESKRQQRWRTECARIKKANQRNGTSIPAPTYEEFIAGLEPAARPPSVPGPGPQNVPEDNAQCPQGQTLQETGTGTETETEKKDANASLVVGADDVRAAFDEWNALAKRLDLPVARSLTADRRKAIRTRLSDGGLARWREALAAVEASAHCRGDNDRSWRADLDFVCQAKSWRRLLEGSYGREHAASGGTAAAPTFDGPPELRQAVVAAKDEDFALRWLTGCSWNPDGRQLVARNSFTAETLRRELGPHLERWRVEVVERERAAA